MKDTTSKSLAVRNGDTAVTLAVDPAAAALSVQQVLGQVALIQQIMGAAMKEGEHYGKIPGCGDKATLLKPGAEKLCLTFRLAPTYDVDERELANGHREYRVTCALTSILGNSFIGQGVGTCSTMESKYRFTKGEGEVTDKPVPRAYWDVRQEDPAKAQELIGGKGFNVKKVDGKGWMITKGGGKVEHTNPADHYNTVLKMAKKRALVDAVLTATAASDIFTQDLEDLTANMAAHDLAAAGDGGQSNGGQTVAAPSQRGSSSARALPAPKTPAAAETFEEAPAARMTVQQAWNTEIHFGKNKGTKLKDLSPNQKEFYAGKWLKGEHRSPADHRLAEAIRIAMPLKSDEDQTQEAEEYIAVDFRETRIHFGKNRGLMLSELTPQQVNWYETDWMPKKEVNGPSSMEDIALIKALKTYRDWRGGQSRSATPPRGGQASAAPIMDDGGKKFVPPSDDDPNIPF